MDSQKLIYIALAILVVVIIVIAVITLTHTGSSIVNNSTNEVNQTVKDAKREYWEYYDNKVVLGSEVINCINKTWWNDNIDVIVSTIDSATDSSKGEHWWRYNATNKGFINIAQLHPTVKNAMDKPLTNNATIWTATITGATDGSPAANGGGAPWWGDPLTTPEGYNPEIKDRPNGWINPEGDFLGIVMRDANDVIRRIAFAEQVR